MSKAETAELFRRDGTEFRSIHLSMEEEGGLKLSAQDMGPSVEAFWGDDEYEFWIDIPARAVCHLAFALLRERYAGREGAVAEFRTFCEQNAIEHTFDSWV